MPFNNRNRSLLSLVHHTDRDLRYLLDLSRDLKRAKYSGSPRNSLAGKNIALIFEKTSTRTRCAFEVAAHDEGAHVTYIDPTSSQIGHKESMKDTRPGPRPHVRRHRNTAAALRKPSTNSPSTPESRSSTGSPMSSIRPRCSPMC